MSIETEITPDQIIKTTILRASLGRVWAALTDHTAFGRWFGVRFDGPFSPGVSVTGVITPTECDANIAAMQKPHEGKRFTFAIDEITPQSRFSYRWHPFALDTATDYSAEPMTLVLFELEEVEAGVRLTVTESGFHGVPASRRAIAFTSNSGGWAAQMRLIEAYLAANA